MTEYYPFIPVVGLCWLGGWALAERSSVAFGLAGVYLLIMLPRTVAASDWNYRVSMRVENLVEGVARAHELHPGQTILLEGVDSQLFYNGILDRPFRVLGIDGVYLTPGSEQHIDAHPELGDIAEFVMPSNMLAAALESGEFTVYDVSGPELRNITSDFAAQPHDLGLPRLVDVGNPAAAPLLGPEWYGADGNHRWMPKKASLRMGAPQSADQKLYLRGYYPAEQLKNGPVEVTVSVDGTALPAQTVRAGGTFELAFPLPAEMTGRPELQVAVEVSRTFRTGADLRDLGLAFGEFEVK